MSQEPSKATLDKIRRLARIARELSGGADFPITRLTILKSLCEDAEVAASFAVYLASRVGQSLSETPDELIRRSVERLRSYVDAPSGAGRKALGEALVELRSINDEYKPVPFGSARVIRDKNALIVEDAVQCALSPHSAPSLAYHLARDYAERYDPGYGTGLIPASAPLVTDIVDFWCEYYSLDRDEL